MQDSPKQTDAPAETAPKAGFPVALQPGLRRILAPNPSPMTYHGTNTYLIGTRGLAVIDPGPDLPAHRDAILRACTAGQAITHIFVTHAHRDHSEGAAALAKATGAPVYGYGPAGSGRSPIMAGLAAQGTVSGGEGVDGAYRPDIALRDGGVIDGDGWRLTAWHLPGHMADHLGFALDDALFCGDLIMGWSTSLISPPDGDLDAFMTSLARLADRPWQVLYPGHGAPVTEPKQRIEALRAHRAARGEALFAALAKGPASARALAETVYTDTPPALLPAAERNVLAHLIALLQAGLVRTDPPLTTQSIFHVTTIRKPLDGQIL